MKISYIANDGTSFYSEKECQQYETKNAISEYEKEWGEHISLKERAYKVKALWKNQSRRGLPDDYLSSQNQDTRAKNPIYIAEEFDYGIVYMRDDAVNILLRYIDLLEG